MQWSSGHRDAGLTLGEQIGVKWSHFTDVFKQGAKVTGLPVAFTKTQDELLLDPLKSTVMNSCCQGNTLLLGLTWMVSRYHFLRLGVSLHCATKQDPKGPSWDRPLPHSLCFSSSPKYPDDSIHSTCPELFYRC